MRRLAQRALSLGAANAYDYAMQFLLPMVLARCLNAVDFGHYRLLWLAVGTVMALVTLAVPGSLYYYLPRSSESHQRLYINQTLLFLVAAGLIAAWAVSAWNPWLPPVLRGLTEPQIVVPAFVLLWVIASLLDLLPTVEERITWQAGATISLATVRAVALSLAAFLTGDLQPVLITLLAFVAFKVALLLRYVESQHGLGGPLVRRAPFTDQLKMSAPFWAGALLYGLRAQADQWVAAALFALSSFAAFSIAAVLGPMVNLFRQSVNFAFLPTMSRLQASGNITGMLDLNSRANVMVGALALPLLAFAFVFAEEIVTIVYTDTYVEAAPVMRVYVVGLVAMVVELAAISLVLRKGMLMMWVNLGTLVIAVAVNWVMAQKVGLAGAAFGTVVAMYVDRVVTLWRISKHTGVPVGRMQDWRALAVLAFLSALAAAVAWSVVGHYLPESGPYLRAVAGAVILAVTYAALRASLGMDRDLVRMMVRGLRRSSS
jgi:O-antigen/teichoic acid export membrane protein